jgi:hypothetical protein
MPSRIIPIYWIDCKPWCPAVKMNDLIGMTYPPWANQVRRAFTESAHSNG